MGFFDLTIKPKVTKDEFHLVIGHLVALGFTPKEIGDVQSIFLGNFDQLSPEKRNVDAHSLTLALDWLRKNPHKHALSPHRIIQLEEAMIKKM